MAILLILIAMTHQRDIAATSQLLNQPQSELLAVILDLLVGAIEANAAVKQLSAVTPAKFGPTDLVEPKQVEQLFARPKIRHPLVIPRFLKTPPAYTRRQDPQPIVFSVNRRVNGFRSNHIVY